MAILIEGILTAGVKWKHKFREFTQLYINPKYNRTCVVTIVIFENCKTINRYKINYQSEGYIYRIKDSYLF